MRGVRILLMVLLGFIACAGIGIILLAGVGDAGVVASTGGVYQALEVAGQHDNASLRNELYAVVLRLQQPWTIVNICGFIVVGAAVCSFSMVWRNVR